MELILEKNGLLSGLKQEGHCTIALPSGRYKLQVVREEEITKIQPYPLDITLEVGNLSCFPLLLLTIAQNLTNNSEATWLTIL